MDLLTIRFCQFCGQSWDGSKVCCPSREFLKEAEAGNADLEQTIRQHFPLKNQAMALSELFKVKSLVIMALDTTEAWAVMNAIQIGISWKPGLVIAEYAKRVGQRIQSHICPPGSILETMANRGWE